jgi:type II secretory pathway component PulM
MKAWFLGLKQRERLILIGGAAAALLIVLWQFGFRPLVNGSAELRDAVTDKQRLLVDIGRAEALGSAEGPSESAASQSLVVLIESTATSHGLALGRSRPDGNDGLNISFQGVSFDALLSWLITLETTHGVRVESASFSSAREQGLVNGQLFLRR